MGPLGEVSSGSWGSSCPTCGRRTRCGCNSGYFSAFSSWPESGWSTSLCRSSTRKSVGDTHLFCHNFFSQNFYFLKFNFAKFTLSKHNLTKSKFFIGLLQSTFFFSVCSGRLHPNLEQCYHRLLLATDSGLCYLEMVSGRWDFWARTPEHFPEFPVDPSSAVYHQRDPGKHLFSCSISINWKSQN